MHVVTTRKTPNQRGQRQAQITDHLKISTNLPWYTNCSHYSPLQTVTNSEIYLKTAAKARKTYSQGIEKNVLERQLQV